MMKQPVPTLDQICTWCETNGNHPTEGWLLLLLDGTYSTDELRAAILANRAPEPKTALDADTKSLEDAVCKLPEYRGWYVTLDDDYPRRATEQLVWKHEDNDTKIWLALFHTDRDRIELSVDVEDPNDDPNYPRGAHETLPEHTAAAVFAICKPFLDEHSYDDASDDESDAAATEVKP